MIKWILSSSVLIGVVIGLRYLFRGKISAKLQYALWVLVLVRLLMPSGIFQVPFSVENVVGTVRSQPVVRNVVAELQKPALLYNEAYEKAEDQMLPSKPIGGYKPTPAAAEKINERAGLLMRISTPSFVIQNVLTVIWYIGIAVVAVTFLISNIRFAHKLRRKRQLLCKGNIRIYTCEDLNTPCLFGFFRPAIYLSPDDANDEQRSAHILAHEHTHLKHWDHIWAFFRCVCLALHWYNPLVWIAAILSRQDSELACDESTINKLGEQQRIPYGETLVQTTCAVKPSTGILGIATTMTGGKQAIKQRILRIAKKFKFNIYAFICVLLVAAVCVGCTWFGGVPADDEIVTVYLLDRTVTTNYNGNTGALTSSQRKTAVYQYDANFNLLYAPGHGNYKYDENNRLLYKQESTSKDYEEYTYNSDGQIIQIKVRFGQYNYTYDAQGHLIHCEGTSSGDAFTIDYSYDSNGVLRSSRKEHLDGTYGRYQTYNADGNLIKDVRYQHGEPYHTEEYTYDPFGRVVAHSKISTGYNNSIYNNHYTYTYDLAGRLIKEVYDTEGSVNNDFGIRMSAPYTVTYRYDLQGNMTEKITQYEDSTVTNTNAFTYDIYGRITRCQIDNFFDLRYTYDGNGNILTESSYSKDGELQYIRTYSYYTVQVPRKDAERLLAQQDEVINFLFESSADVPEPKKEPIYP